MHRMCCKFSDGRQSSSSSSSDSNSSRRALQHHNANQFATFQLTRMQSDIELA